MAEACEVCSKWKLPTLAADAAVFRKNQVNGGDLEILLITRAKYPFEGQLAFPGGKVEYGEDPEEGVLRELSEECNLKGHSVELIAVLGEPGRDPRHHTVSFLYSVDVDDFHSLKGGDDASDAKFYSVKEILEGKFTLGYDHLDGVKKAVAWLDQHRSKRRKH